MADSVRPDAATAERASLFDPDVVEEPLSYDQATLAVTLCDSLYLHRDQKKLLWHVEVNEKVELRQADGTRRGVFPDLYLVVGIPQLPPGVYRPWVRGRAPDLIVEFATADSIVYDRGEKLAFYRNELRVPEYFVFDVDAVAIEGQIEGYRLDEGAYRPIAPAPARPGAGGIRLPSLRLALELGTLVNPISKRVELRAFVPGSDDPLPTPADAIIREERAARANAEADRTRAEADCARAEAELEEFRRRFGPLGQP